MLNQLRGELTAEVPKVDLEKAKTAASPEAQQLKKFLASDKLDAKLVKYGPAMNIYTDIQKASKKAKGAFASLRRRTRGGSSLLWGRSCGGDLVGFAL
jgi:hypothetical protein